MVPGRLRDDVIDTQKREDFKAGMNETVHDVEFRTTDFSFQTAKSNSLKSRHCRARPGNPSPSKMFLRRLMDAGHLARRRASRFCPGMTSVCLGRHHNSKRTFATPRRDAPLCGTRRAELNQ